MFICTTRVRRPARRPRLMALAKSSLRRIRKADGSTNDPAFPARRRGQGERAASRQTVRSLRPLRRRAEMMARPARVRMRSRKPWVFARRRLFGW
jgi:hypothetical protein